MRHLISDCSECFVSATSNCDVLHIKMNAPPSTLPTSDATPSTEKAPIAGRKRPRLMLAVDNSMHSEIAASRQTDITRENAWWRNLNTSTIPRSTLGVVSAMSSAAQSMLKEEETPRTQFLSVFGRSVAGFDNHSPSTSAVSRQEDSRAPTPAIASDTARSPPVIDATGAHSFRNSAISNPFSSRNAPAFRYAVISSQGARPINEDRYTVAANLLGKKQNTLYGVFDGHGGVRAATFAAKHIVDCVEGHWKEDDVISGIKAAFHAADAEFLQVHESKPSIEAAVVSASKHDSEATGASSAPQSVAKADLEGTTVLLVITIGPDIYIAHAGDSRALLVRSDNSFEQLTADHVFDNPQERARVESCGGFLDQDGRVCGLLESTRGLGEKCLKGLGVISEPDIKKVVWQARDAFILLLTDGVWKSLPNALIADIVCTSTPTTTTNVSGSTITETETTTTGRRFAEARTIAERVIAAAKLKGTTDDATVMVIDLMKPSGTLTPSNKQG